MRSVSFCVLTRCAVIITRCQRAVWLLFYQHIQKTYKRFAQKQPSINYWLQYAARDVQMSGMGWFNARMLNESEIHFSKKNKTAIATGIVIKLVQ